VIIISSRPSRLDACASYLVRCEPGKEVDMLKAFLPENHAHNPEAQRQAAETFAKATNAVVFYGSDGLGLQASQAVAHACAELLIKTDHVGRPDNGLVAVWHAANLQGAWDIGFRPESNLGASLSTSDVVVIAGADPAGDDPALAGVLKSPELFLVVQELFLTETARLADVVLPVAAVTEREGSYTSGERRVQRFYPIQTVTDLKPDFAVTSHLAQLLGVTLEDRSAALVLEQISGQVEGYQGLTYARLAETSPQLPDVGRSELYYGGTTYENRQGLGIQLEIDTIHSRLMKIPELAAPGLPTVKEDELLLLPVTVLYDRGRLITETTLLDQRREQPVLRLNPQTAQKLGLQSGVEVGFELGKTSYSLKVDLDDTVPPGVGLAARSMGLPLVEPVVVKPLMVQ
jgi:NADH-quinone oxidoreductase subunit G